MNHTPGPWIAYDGQLLTSEGGFIARFSSANYPHQNNANARLAAAAPNLLAALEDAAKSLEWMVIHDGHVSHADRLNAAKAAIRKAKGED